MRQLLTILVAGLVLNTTATAQDKHIDPSEKAHAYALTIAKHTAIEFNIDTAKTGTAASSRDLQICNSRVAEDQDVATAVSVAISGTLKNFGTAMDGLDVITTDAEMDSVLAKTEAWVKMVTSIGHCGGPAAGIVGCAPEGRTMAIISTMSAANTGETIVHELGHNVGLSHRAAPGKPIMTAVDFGNNEVNAAEAAAYHTKGTEAGPNRPVDVAFVIDDTGSMAEEIAGVRNSLTTHIGTYPAASCVAFEMVTFKDNVTEAAPTTDLAAIRTQVGNLVASGGDDCPEASVEALNQVRPKVKDRGRVLLATDADPHPGQDIPAATAAFRARGVRVDVVVTGNCGSSKRGPNDILAGRTGPPGKVPSPRLSTGKVMIPSVARADTLVLGDDDYQEVMLPYTFTFAGTSHSTVFVGSNGFLSFGEGDASTSGSGAFLASGIPRLAGLWVDLNPSAGGRVFTHVVGDDFQVTWREVPYFGSSNTASFSITARADNTFAFEYGTVQSGNSPLVGVSVGNVADPGGSDLSALSSPIDADDTGGSVYEDFGSFDLEGTTLEFAEVTTEPPRVYNSIDAFSLLARGTGGVFAYVPEVNNNDPAATQHFENVMFNIVQGGLTQAISLVEPPSGPVGSSLTVTLTGSGTNFQPTTQLEVSGDGVSVAGVTALSSTELQAVLDIDAGATMDFRDLLAITDLGGGAVDSARAMGGFRVAEAPSGATILGVSPASGRRGQTMDVTVSGFGTSFSSSSILSMGSGINVVSATANSSTSLTARVTILANTTIGFRDVTVTTGSEVAFESVTGPFFVAEEAEATAAAITAVSPSAAAPGTEQTVTVSAENTNFVDGVTVLSFTGDGVEVLSTSVSSATQATASIRVADTASPGFRDLRMTTDAEVVVLLDAFLVTQLAPETPVPTGPEDGSSEVLPGDVTISWQEADRAAAYHLQVARDEAFADLAVDETVNGTAHTASLDGGTQYWWRVRSSNTAGFSSWTVVQSFTTQSAVGIEDEVLPTEFALHAPFPNPFERSATIPFDLPRAAAVRLTVYNAIGQPVRTLVDGAYPAGRHRAVLQAGDLPSGVYFCEIRADGQTRTSVLVLRR